jgi:hypothetical protein
MGIADTEMKKNMKLKTVFGAYIDFFPVNKNLKFKKTVVLTVGKFFAKTSSHIPIRNHGFSDSSQIFFGDSLCKF